ncbi:hypothetical protein NEDG_00803 [Nematocida displodere]|uniref:Uncharacterized protein n=1 Tax=Nematocida displodere TaxID=1805483 RepID=A0A177EE38_9MICR|nr:hypothetical protein NEDG_00803 [Nematocida displodere]
MFKVCVGALLWVVVSFLLRVVLQVGALLQTVRLAGNKAVNNGRILKQCDRLVVDALGTTGEFLAFVGIIRYQVIKKVSMKSVWTALSVLAACCLGKRWLESKDEDSRFCLPPRLCGMPARYIKVVLVGWSLSAFKHQAQWARLGLVLGGAWVLTPNTKSWQVQVTVGVFYLSAVAMTCCLFEDTGHLFIRSLFMLGHKEPLEQAECLYGSLVLAQSTYTAEILQSLVEGV